MLALKGKGADEASTAPSGGCRFCPLVGACEDGKRHLAGEDRDLDLGPAGDLLTDL